MDFCPCEWSNYGLCNQDRSPGSMVAYYESWRYIFKEISHDHKYNFLVVFCKPLTSKNFYSTKMNEEFIGIRSSLVKTHDSFNVYDISNAIRCIQNYLKTFRASNSGQDPQRICGNIPGSRMSRRNRIIYKFTDSNILRSA